jgi:hypothetical protein
MIRSVPLDYGGMILQCLETNTGTGSFVGTERSLVSESSELGTTLLGHQLPNEDWAVVSRGHVTLNSDYLRAPQSSGTSSRTRAK